MRKSALIMAASALLLGAVSCSEKKAEVPVKKEISVQLYSIRSVIGNPEKYAQNHEEAFKALAEMGYTSVEAACYSDGKLYGVDPEQYKADLEAAGLKSLSTHIGHNLSDEELASGDFTESMKWWDQAIAAHKAAGCKYIVCPSFKVPETLAGLKTYCDYFNAIGANAGRTECSSAITTTHTSSKKSKTPSSMNICLRTPILRTCSSRWMSIGL